MFQVYNLSKSLIEMPTKMEGRVPGGRDKYSMDECNGAIVDGEMEDVKTTGSPQVAGGSKSLPRYGPESEKTELSESFQHKSSTLDRKHRSSMRHIKSIGSFLNRMVSHVTPASLYSPPRKLKFNKNSPNQAATPRVHTSPVQLEFSKDHTPGNVGLKNHGNTCFMNAVIQCLSHTELLLEYFITNNYKNDIKRNNKYRSKKYGSAKGELTEHLAVVLKSLWSCKYSSEISSDFKNVIGKYGQQYRGYSQHDAQEFLLWLLDKVHEDVNIATKHKYKPNKSNLGRSDDVIAAEVMANQMRCNNSYIYDLFQALYRSSLTCALCKQHSNTFDPFLSVSLPIPQKCQRPVYITVVYHKAQPKQVRIGLLMNTTDDVHELRHTLAADTKIPATQIILTEIYYDGFHRTFHDSQPLSDIHESDNVYAIETPALHEGESAEKIVSVVLLNKQGVAPNAKRFGGPVVLEAARDVAFEQLLQQINISVQPAIKDTLTATDTYAVRVVDGVPGQCYLWGGGGGGETQGTTTTTADLPLLTQTVDRALSNCITGGGPVHVKLLLEWDHTHNIEEDHIEEHSSVRQVKVSSEQPSLGTLDECFQLYTQEEKLGTDDAWYCPNCLKQRMGTTKTLCLWSLPDIFVVHLKRFKQVGLRRTKLNTLITFPVSGLDMSRHVAKRSSTGAKPGLPSNKPIATWSPWRPNQQGVTRTEDYIYDLYAVCNHYGNMQGGHYTAFCKHPLTQKWFTFDDLQVSEMREGEVVTRAAYLLFYQRRSAATHTIQGPQHWMQQLSTIGYVHRAPRAVSVSKSHDDLLDEERIDGLSLSDHNRTVDDDAGAAFVRTTNPYATMRTTAKTNSGGGSGGGVAGSTSMGQIGAKSASPGAVQNGFHAPASSPVAKPRSNTATSPVKPMATTQAVSVPSQRTKVQQNGANYTAAPVSSSSAPPDFTPPEERLRAWGAKAPVQLGTAPAPRIVPVSGKHMKEKAGSPTTTMSSSDGSITSLSHSGGENHNSTSRNVTATSSSSPAKSTTRGGGEKGGGGETTATGAWDYSRTIYMQESCV